MEVEEIKKIQKQLCFGSLSFCCDKECPIRNKVIKDLKLDKKKFYKLKEIFDKNLLDTLIFKKGKKGGENVGNKS